MKDLMHKFLRRIVDVQEHEIRALFFAGAYFFFLLASYYILRPIRDEMGVAGGVQNLPWLFTGTLVATLVGSQIFSALVVKFPVKRFVSLTYRFIMVNLLVFFISLKLAGSTQNIWIGRVFFVWISMFNMFWTSVFWAMMTDVFHNEQSKRLFGFIGAGGTLGGVVGSAVTASLAHKFGTINLFLVSMVLLECGVQCMFRLPLRVKSGPEAESEVELKNLEKPIGGGFLAGIAHTSKSPYLIGICVYMLLFTVGSTFLYFQQSQIVGATITDRVARTAFLAKIDLVVNVLTLAIQFFLTGRIVKNLGVAVTLMLLPVVSVIGFAQLGLRPVLMAVVIFQVVRRAGNFAVAGPTREVLFTVLAREDKYKAKNFIDTFIYRAGDQVGAWTSGLLTWLGLTIGGISLVAVPISLAWLGVSLWLGRRQQHLAKQSVAEPVFVPPVPLVSDCG
ncbi:MAG: MFS transporter [Blastocatellia bacterium]|nr:MFS transporter [Blastocatellia bacterium]